MNGSINYPYKNIITAIENISYNNTIIYLLGGDFNLNPLGNNNPLQNISYNQIIIQPYYCNQSNHSGCYNQGERPIIILTNETITFYITYKLILKNIIFSHNYSFDINCSGCNYCPYAINHANDTILGDKGNSLKSGEFLNQSYCNVFINDKLFSISNGELIIEVIFI